LYFIFVLVYIYICTSKQMEHKFGKNRINSYKLMNVM